MKGEWVDMPLFAVSINGILCGALVGVITVFIAAHSPAKQAAMVSSVAAGFGYLAMQICLKMLIMQPKQDF